MPASEALDADWALLGDTVGRAAALGLELSRRKNLRHWTKPDGSHVTEGDLAINALFEERLRAARPDDGWLSEETADDPAARVGKRRLWIIDPIDGTRAFLEGRDDWCVAAALAVDGRPVLSAIASPLRGEVFTARAGLGAFLGGRPLVMADPATLEGARIAGNRKALAALSHLGIVADHSGALPLQLRLAAVATGLIDGAVSVGHRNDWDLAAGELVVIEAGGAVSGNSGESYVYNRREPWQQGLVAAGAKRHAALIDALRTP